MAAKITRRIRQEVSDWDSRHQLFSEIQTEMMKQFQDHFELMENQLCAIEGEMLGKDKTIADVMGSLRALHHNPGFLDQLSTVQKVCLGLAMPILLPLGVLASVLVLPFAGLKVITSKLDEARMLKEYKNDRTTAMAKATQEHLSQYGERKILKKVVRAQMQALMGGVEKLVNTIPSIIETDRTLINKLQRQRQQSETSLAEDYLPLLQECKKLCGHLDLFYATQTKMWDLSLNDIEIDPILVRTNKWLDIYKGILQRPSQAGTTVAVLKRHAPLNMRHVSDQLMQAEHMR